MPDIASILLRKSVGALSSGRTHCSSCRRTPLVGERLHETDEGRQLCELCVVDTHASGHVISVRRVHASERKLPVGPRIAA
jgi:CRISPR/Cas system-associated protein Cas10 (large subunit of type III CRISPR-Cas system)